MQVKKSTLVHSSEITAQPRQLAERVWYATHGRLPTMDEQEDAALTVGRVAAAW